MTIAYKVQLPNLEAIYIPKRFPEVEFKTRLAQNPVILRRQPASDRGVQFHISRCFYQPRRNQPDGRVQNQRGLWLVRKFCVDINLCEDAPQSYIAVRMQHVVSTKHGRINSDQNAPPHATLSFTSNIFEQIGKYDDLATTIAASGTQNRSDSIENTAKLLLWHGNNITFQRSHILVRTVGNYNSRHFSSAMVSPIQTARPHPPAPHSRSTYWRRCPAE